MGKRVALLIATSRYLDPKLTALDAAVDEAQQLAQLLLDQELGGFESAEVVRDGGKAAVERAVEDFLRERDADDQVLLYLTGHGIKNDHGRLFFAASDTDTRRPHATAVPASVVRDLLDECPARAKLVLLDCCYSGAFTRGPNHMSDEWVTVGQQFGQGTYVLAASNELEFAYVQERLVYDERRARFSVFSDALIKGIGTGAAARGDTTAITADDLYAFVFEEVRKAGVEQTPTKSGRSEGQFVVSRVRTRRIVVDGGSASPRLADLLPADGPAGDLSAPLGQAQHTGAFGEPVVRVDLAGQEGHLAVVGRIYSGKSTLVHTLVSGLAHRRTPEQVTFYCLDGGGGFRALRDLPHLREVIAPTRQRSVEALLERLARVVAERDHMFRQLRIPRTAIYRELRDRGAFRGGDHSDVFLVIDDWQRFHDAVPLIEDAVHQIAGTGLRFGVHVVVTARNWAELPAKITPLLRGRVELQLDDPHESKISAELAATLPEQPGWGLYGGRRFLGAVADQDSEEQVSDVLRRLSALGGEGGWDVVEDEPAPAAVREPTFLELHALGPDPGDLDPERAWSRPAAGRYRVPFGSTGTGEPVWLDLAPPAAGGTGPHGLLIGATGSGKSELLRTLLLGLVATHSPADLNLLLVDFKDGSTYRGLDRAPHVAATVTGLGEDPALLDRLVDVLGGELARRHRDPGPVPPPLLLVCVDEFSEVLAAKPAALDLLVHAARVGPGLRVHLLLASQRLDASALRGLDEHLTCRIGLKTFSATESRAVLGVPDAAELPPVPGSGYLVVRGGPPVRFKAAYVSDPHGDGNRSLLDLVVDRLAGGTPRARRVWTPPLGEPPSLDALLAGDAAGAGGLRVPVGLVDRPFEQRRDPLWADFSGAGPSGVNPAGAAAHGAVVGGPQSGKSTLLRTLIAAVALTHAPEEAQFYCLDLGGGKLAALADLPHVGAVAGRFDADLVRRAVADLSALLARRERRFAELGIGSVAEFRERKRRGELRDDDYGDVFLVVDGWLSFRELFDELEPAVAELVARGAPHGLHVVVSATRWVHLRPAMRDLMGVRFELRLSDPDESEVDRGLAAGVPAGRPGRGLSAEKLHFLAALPRADASSDVASLAAGARDLVTRVAGTWLGRSAPAVRLLPDLLPHAELAEQVGRRGPLRRGLVPIGVDEDDLAPVCLDFDADPHLLAVADVEGGKTNLLRVVLRGIVDGRTAKEALIVLVDYRRSLLGFVETDHLLAYAVSSNQLADLVKDVQASMKSRVPGPGVTQEQLRDRSWWRGPELFVVVDDYDLVARGGHNPLQPLVELIPSAEDIGLHLVVVRRTGGVGRALFDPVLNELRESGAAVLVGSGSPEEGVVVDGVKPSPQPPGRGTLVTRAHGRRRVQVARLDG